MGQPIPQPVATFLRNIRGVRLERAILFGSRARGDYLLESDYDLILVSPDFAAIPFVRRMSRMRTFWEGPGALELLCYTPEEFARKAQQIGLVQQAVQEGLVCHG